MEAYIPDFSVVEKDRVERFAKDHPVGFCTIPKSLGSLKKLDLSGRRFCAPKRVDLRDYCGPTEDQGKKPWCAAYSASSWAENILWRKRDYYEHIDPTWIYSWAKAHDGDPNGDGTTLVAVLDALRNKGVFDGTECRTRVIGSDMESIKYGLHKFGAILCGFDVTREWYGCIDADHVAHDDSGNPIIMGLDRLPSIGGHAVLGCGYNSTGLMIQNSWGFDWGRYGFATIAWSEVARTFMYGAVLDHCLDGLEV